MQIEPFHIHPIESTIYYMLHSRYKSHNGRSLTVWARCFLTKLFTHLYCYSKAQYFSTTISTDYCTMV